LVPPRHVAFQEVARGIDIAGVVDQHVDAPVLLFDAIEHGIYLCLIGDIGSHPEIGIGFGGGVFGAPGVEIVEHDQRTLLGEARGDRKSDAVPAARDEHDLFLKSFAY
jgi:hypothetical protein